MILTDFQHDIKASINLKNFKNRDENYVREEFLIPIFKAAGYDAFGTEIVARGVNLKKYVLKQKGRRLNIYPDFVLYKNSVPIWVIDAKSPKIKVDSKTNIEQITNYSNYLGCNNAILSNAIETILYKTSTKNIATTDFFTIEDINSTSKFARLINSIRPEYAIRNIYSFNEAIELYGTDNYVDRSYLMKMLQVYSFQEIHPFLKDFSNPKSYLSKHFRDRALPAILISKYNDKDNSLFKRIVEFSLNDSDAIVRENFLTCIISRNTYIDPKYIWDYFFSHNCETVLERVLYISLLSAHRISKDFIKTKYLENSFIREFVDLLFTSRPVSFPIALLLQKPVSINYVEYVNYLSFLPSLIEKIEQCSNTHYETFKVLNDCLRFAKKNNINVYGQLFLKATKKQKSIMKFYSDDKIM